MKMLLECPECQCCFLPSELLEAYSITNELFEYVSGERNSLPDNLTEEETYKFLLDENARFDCPECGEVLCIEDMCEV